MSYFNTFSMANGLYVGKEKSEIIFGGVEEDVKEHNIRVHWV